MHLVLNKRLRSQQQQQQLQHVPLYQSLVGGRKPAGSVPAAQLVTSSVGAGPAQPPGTNFTASTTPVAMPLDKKIAILNQCIRFDKELLMLEVYLVYGLWFTCQQVPLS
jgi:hypothetical protein